MMYHFFTFPLESEPIKTLAKFPPLQTDIKTGLNYMDQVYRLSKINIYQFYNHLLLISANMSNSV